MITYRQPFKTDWPVTQKYGETITSSFHTGIDYACPLNTSILASADGTVVFAGLDKTGYGNMVILQHPDGLATLYAHLNSIHVVLGEKVKQGTLLGHSGNTGNSTGPHLHFEVRTQWNDYKTHFDPMTLPLTSVDDSVQVAANTESKALISGPVMVIAPFGVYAHNEGFTSKAALPYGTKLTFTGKTTEHNGFIFCECTVWVAQNDGSTKLLMNIQS